MSMPVQRPFQDSYADVRHNLRLWRRRRVPSTGKSGSVGNERTGRGPLNGFQCTRVPYQQLLLWHLWQSDSGLEREEEFVRSGEFHARQVLSGAKGVEKLQALLDLRAEALAGTKEFGKRSRSNTPPTAEELNNTYNSFLERARKLLGPDFKAVFGPEARAKADIVDPSMMTRGGKGTRKGR